MIKSPKLVLSQKKHFYLSENAPWHICKAVLRKFFKFPRDATAIQFCAYKHPRPGTIPVTFDHKWDEIHIEGEIYYVYTQMMKDIRRRTKKCKTMYVALDYWN